MVAVNRLHRNKLVERTCRNINEFYNTDTLLMKLFRGSKSDREAKVEFLFTRSLQSTLLRYYGNARLYRGTN